ncbi:hypothetical protein QUA20_01255 [Microcoleus sp. Pol7_A1]|uniref:hypothetical protein n=1 Tax=unclassified Microcoleus TaxID=2642155 RepID=UPI002FD66429
MQEGRKKEEGRRKKEEGRRKKDEGRHYTDFDTDTRMGVFTNYQLPTALHGF